MEQTEPTDTRRPSVARSFSLSDGASKHHISHLDTRSSLPTIATRSDDTLVARDERRPMWFAEMNPFAPETVVLLHILFSSHLEWKQVWPKLNEYHLLVPDLPCHSRSQHVCRQDEFSVALCADLVADLIRTRAHDGHAHVVGLSTGGFVAMDMVRRHPGVVRSAMVAGAWPVTGMLAKLANHPRLTWAALWSLLHSPGHVFFKASGLGGEYQNDELLSEIKGNGSARLLKAGSISDWTKEKLDFGGNGVRMCFVVGAKFDNVEDCLQAVQVLRSQGAEVPLYAIRDGIHAWNLQFPLLFAQGIRAFVEGRPMPTEYEEVQVA